MLPPVTDHEALVAAKEIEAADPTLPKFSRRDAYYPEAIRPLGVQLTAGVAAVCARADTEECRFMFHYVDDDEVNAFADEGGDMTLRPAFSAFLAEAEPGRSATRTSLTPLSLRFSAWAWPWLP
jgi:predicted Zn-dependent protease